MPPPRRQLSVDPNNVADYEDSRDSCFSSNASNYERRHNTVTVPGSPQRPRRRPRRPGRGGRSAYSDDRRVEVARVRAVGACQVCKRRKVRCTHVLNQDGSPRNPTTLQPESHSKSTGGSCEDTRLDETSHNGLVAKEIVRQPTLGRYLDDLEEDPATWQLVPSKSQSPEVEAQLRIGSQLGKLSNKIPQQWQYGSLPAELPQNNIYPTELPNDGEMALDQEAFGYQTIPHQVFHGATQNIQAVPPGTNNCQQEPLSIYHPSDPINIEDSISVHTSNSYPSVYGQTNHWPMATSFLSSQMYSDSRSGHQNAATASIPSYSHVAPLATKPQASIYSHTLTQDFNKPFASLQRTTSSSFNTYTNFVPPSQPGYDTEDASSNLEPVPSLDYGPSHYGTSHYGTVLSQDRLSNNGDAGSHLLGLDQNFSLTQPEIPQAGKPPDINSLASPIDVECFGNWTDYLNSSPLLIQDLT